MRRFLIAVAIVLFVSAVALSMVPHRNITIERKGIVPSSPLSSALHPDGELPKRTEENPFTGLPCARGTLHRPFAVMLAGDTVTRPLSGIAEADLVVEMPVITGGINRLMAVYACLPQQGADLEVGSVRSARDDYIPLAAAFDAIYAHWGGSHFALDALNRHVIDNIDALKNPFGAYFRKRGIVAPHNGFTTLVRLMRAAEGLKYRTTMREDFSAYPHAAAGEVPSSARTSGRMTIGYPGAYRVEWRYDAETRTYRRFRGGTPELDKVTNAQVAVGTVVIMRTEIRQIEGQYNDVRVVGEGEATVYRDGVAIAARWQKDPQPLSAPLRFIDEKGEAIPFAPGPLWINIVEKNTPVTVSSP